MSEFVLENKGVTYNSYNQKTITAITHLPKSMKLSGQRKTSSITSENISKVFPKGTQAVYTFQETRTGNIHKLTIIDGFDRYELISNEGGPI
jgi:hypothetical protein